MVRKIDNLIVLTLCSEVLRLAAARADPCKDSVLLEQLDVREPSNGASNGHPNVCDYQLYQNKWYNFSVAPGYRMPESCAPAFGCGTNMPIWMNGTHPNAKNPGPLTVRVCATSLTGDCCGAWIDTIEVTYCETADGRDHFFVYRLKNVPYCDMGYCAQKRQPPDVNVTTTAPTTKSSRPTVGSRTSPVLVSSTTTFSTTSTATLRDKTTTPPPLSFSDCFSDPAVLAAIIISVTVIVAVIVSGIIIWKCRRSTATGEQGSFKRNIIIVQSRRVVDKLGHVVAGAYNAVRGHTQAKTTGPTSEPAGDPTRYTQSPGSGGGTTQGPTAYVNEGYEVPRCAFDATAWPEHLHQHGSKNVSGEAQYYNQGEDTMAGGHLYDTIGTEN